MLLLSILWSYFLLDSPFFNIILFIEVWCNGSTKDFGSFSSGSNPDTSTNTVGNVFVVISFDNDLCGGQAEKFLVCPFYY